MVPRFDQILAGVLAGIGALLSLLGALCLAGGLRPNDAGVGQIERADIFLGGGLLLLSLGLPWVLGSLALLRGRRRGYGGWILTGITAGLLQGTFLVTRGSAGAGLLAIVLSPAFAAAVLAIWRLISTRKSLRSS